MWHKGSWSRGVAGVCAAALLFAACGDDDDAPASAASATVGDTARTATTTSAPAATSAASATATSASATATRELALLGTVPPVIDALEAALQSGDATKAAAAYADYDATWNGIEVYINSRDRDLYEELEQDLQKKISDGLAAQPADLAALVPVAQQLGTTFDGAIDTIEGEATLSPLFDDVADLRIVRADLRRATAAINAGDVATARTDFTAFTTGYASVKGRVAERSTTVGGEVDATIAKATMAFQDPAAKADTVKPLVAAVTSRYNFAVALWNAAARNADPAKTTYTPEDLTAVTELNDIAVTLGKSFDAWKAGDFAASGASAQQVGTEFAAVQPALATHNADTTLKTSLDAYTGVAGAAGDAAAVATAERSAVEAVAVAEQVVVGQFWDDAALQRALATLPH